MPVSPCPAMCPILTVGGRGSGVGARPALSSPHALIRMTQGVVINIARSRSAHNSFNQPQHVLTSRRRSTHLRVFELLVAHVVRVHFTFSTSSSSSTLTFVNACHHDHRLQAAGSPMTWGAAVLDVLWSSSFGLCALCPWIWCVGHLGRIACRIALTRHVVNLSSMTAARRRIRRCLVDKEDRDSVGLSGVMIGAERVKT